MGGGSMYEPADSFIGGGSFAIVWVALGFLFTTGFMCLWPGFYYAIVVGVFAILRGTALLGDRWYKSNPRTIFIMQIVLAVNLDVVNIALGIIGLVFLSEREVQAGFGRRSS